jgi:hypothetical protein
MASSIITISRFLAILSPRRKLAVKVSDELGERLGVRLLVERDSPRALEVFRRDLLPLDHVLHHCHDLFFVFYIDLFGDLVDLQARILGAELEDGLPDRRGPRLVDWLLSWQSSDQLFRVVDAQGPWG